MCDNYVPLEPSLQLAHFLKLSNKTWDSEPEVPIIDTEITLSGVGVFTQADFNDWWQCVLPIPFLAQLLPVTILNFNPNDPANESQLGAIDAAVTALLHLTEMEKSIAAPGVLSYCHEFLDMVEILDEDKAMREITNPEEIWKFVHFTHAYVQYDASTEVVYVSLHAKCDWDTEHGLQLVYKNGTELYRVSADDGQIT
jgi:hypothetical protein